MNMSDDGRRPPAAVTFRRAGTLPRLARRWPGMASCQMIADLWTRTRPASPSPRRWRREGGAGRGGEVETNPQRSRTKRTPIEYVGDALGQDHDGETLGDAAQRVLSERDCPEASAQLPTSLPVPGAPQRFDAPARRWRRGDTLLPISDDEIESLVTPPARLAGRSGTTRSATYLPTEGVLAHPESMRAAIDGR